MLTLLAFVVGIGLLIGIHEYGHYRMAIACGVRVQRFSIGMGRPLLRWSNRSGDTEFVLALFPFGGYVQMLDERAGPVAEAEKHLAFNTQSLRNRFLIIAAGPLANLLLAVVLYASVNWWGVETPRALLATPVPQSLADRAGLQGGEWVVSAIVGSDEEEPIASFEHLQWVLMQAALKTQDVTLTTSRTDSPMLRKDHQLRLSQLVEPVDDGVMRKIGIVSPWLAPVLREVLPGGAAAASGLMTGDEVLSIDGTAVKDGHMLRQRIRAAVDAHGHPAVQQWVVLRNQHTVHLNVQPHAERVDGIWSGRVGAYIGHPPETVLVRQGVIEGLMSAVAKTSEISLLTVRMLGRMLIGEASLSNLSGPLTMADYAGRSANQGLTAYIQFLALISVSLGVLNLLPLPILDGGYLLYYLWEGVSGRAVPDVWQNWLQRGGMVLLMGMMSLALFNDVVRLLG